jgi:hypothetical protein
MQAPDPTPRRPLRTPPRAATLALVIAAAVAALLARPRPTGAQTILNVERLQQGEVQGWHWGVEGALAVSRGNAEYVDVLAGLVVGHRWPGDWLRLFAGVDYRSETGTGLDRDRYAHVRYNRWLAERWQTFHFVQLQGSRKRLLRSRVLVGSGVRHRLVGGTGTLDIGTGLMYEAESLDPDRVTDTHPVESRAWRMANLVVATRPLTESVRFVGTAYVQPDISAFDDIRVFTELSLLIALTENVDLAVRGEWRHDSRPPGGVVPDDMVVRTGFGLSFR